MLNQTLHQQEGELLEASSAAGQLENAIEQVVESCRSAVALAEEKERFVQKGSEIATSSKQSVEQLAQLIDNTSQTTQDLNSATSEIESTLNTIRDIADQTNLLALNAAIESARAGEHGRGFAVVADEVRKLAERTTTATEEVTDSIKIIQQHTTDAVDRMQSDSLRVKDGVALAIEAGEALNTIVTSTAEVTSMIQNIAASSQEQSHGVDEISRNMDSINNVIKEAAQSTDEAAQSAETLENKSDILRKTVAQFKVEVAA